MATIIRLNEEITDKNAPVLRATITSDDFSGSGEIVGSLTSAVLGGVPMTWGGASGGWTREDGGIVTPQNSYHNALVLAGLPADLSATVTVRELPSGQGDRAMISLRATPTRNTRIYLRFFGDGSLSIWERISDVESEVADSGPGTVRVGDRISFELSGTTARALVNGEVVASGAVTYTAAGEMALTTYPITRAVLDDLVIAEA